MPTKQPRLALVINELSRARIQHLAKKHGRSTSAEIVTAIESWVDQHPEAMEDFNDGFEPTEEEAAEMKKMLQQAERRILESFMLKKLKKQETPDA